MLKFKTEVPKCQGVKLLKYKLCFNIPKHYTKYASVHKKSDADQCLIFQRNVTTAAAAEGIRRRPRSRLWSEIFREACRINDWTLCSPPARCSMWRELKNVCWENKTAANYQLISPISLFSAAVWRLHSHNLLKHARFTFKSAAWRVLMVLTPNHYESVTRCSRAKLGGRRVNAV